MSEREEFSGPNYKERLDISQVFLRHMDRTNFAASARDGSFEEYIKQTMRILPMQWQQWVHDQADRYTITESVLQFKTFSGVRMGSQKDPCLKDVTRSVEHLEDGTVDWSDPNILSPTLKEKNRIDYGLMSQIIFEAAEYAGLSWQTETIAGDRGNHDKIKREKTPYRKEPKVD